MKRLVSTKKLILSIIGLIFVLLIFKIYLVISAKPKIAVDYVAEYNKITRPKNYDPNLNAVDDYQQAFDSFKRMPHQISIAKKYWPTDFNDAEQKMLRQWLASNEPAFKHFSNASMKPYYWFERDAGDDDSIMSMLFPELSPLREVVISLLWDAKFNAFKGKYKDGFDDILVCYRAGQQKCRIPSFLMEQVNGIETKDKSLSTVIIILDKIAIKSEELKTFQDAIQSEFKKDTYTPDFEAERLEFNDKLQRIFLDNHKGNSRLSWNVVKDIGIMCGTSENFKFKCNLFFSCFFGPTKKEVIKNSEETFANLELLKNETPWQINKRDPNYFKRIETSQCTDCGNFTIDMFFSSPNPRLFHMYYRVKTKTEALITILAIRRFKEEKGILPDKLEDLISNGYLQNLPLDPYSDSYLIYKKMNDKFLLYSLGENFKDDGGKEPDKTISTPSGDIIFWPLRISEKYIAEPNDANNTGGKK